MVKINVNVAYQRINSDSLNFLSQHDLHPEFYFSGDDIDAIKRELLLSLYTEVAERKFASTLHAPFFDLNIGARDSQIARVSFERLLWALETASLLKASQVVVHPGYGPWILEQKLDGWLNRARKYLIKLCEHAASNGIKIAFENIYDATPDDLAQLLRLVNSTNAGICFDIGHFNVFSKQPLERWLEILGPHIFELHLHDNNGSSDQHLALGDGRIDYSPLIQWYNQLDSEKKPILTLEMQHRAHLVKSISILKNWII